MLSFVCMLSAFPKRQKPNWLIIALMYVMFAIILVCDWWYLDRITHKLFRAEDVLVLTEKEQYIFYNIKLFTIILSKTMPDNKITESFVDFLKITTHKIIFLVFLVFLYQKDLTQSIWLSIKTKW